MLDIDLIHTCSITHPASTSQNEYGEPVTGGTPVTSACRFYRATGKIISPESGDHHITEPKLMLPSTASVVDGDTITSTVAHFTGPYRVEHVEPIHELFSNVIDHFECYLKAVR